MVGLPGSSTFRVPIHLYFARGFASRRRSQTKILDVVEATGDTDAVHRNEAFAETTGVGYRVAQGTLVAGLSTAALAACIQPALGELSRCWTEPRAEYRGCVHHQAV